MEETPNGVSSKNGDSENLNTEEDCIFCKIVKGEVPANKIADYENFIVMNDIDPIREGHCLIISKKHFENIYDLPSTLGSELLAIAKEQGMRLIKEGKADGVKFMQNNGKPAGQVIFHFHMHVIPAKNGNALGLLRGR